MLPCAAYPLAGDFSLVALGVLDRIKAVKDATGHHIKIDYVRMQPLFAAVATLWPPPKRTKRASELVISGSELVISGRFWASSRPKTEISAQKGH